MSKIFDMIIEAVEDGVEDDVVELVQEALDDGEKAVDILNEALVAGMNEVGDLFAEGEYFLPEVLMSANAMQRGVELLDPFLSAGDVKSKGKIIICTCAGDLHDIGKKLVQMLLRGSGFEVIDLGVDIGVEQIIDAAKEHEPDIIALSAMLTTTMITMEETLDALKENGMDRKIKVMIGGAPVSDDYAGKIGANYSDDATGAVALADKLMA